VTPASATTVAVLAALASTTVTALGTAAQQQATQRVPSAPGLHLRLVLLLARDRLWQVGQVGTLAGFGLYLAALAAGPLTLVQPIMVLGLVLGSVFAAVLARHPVDRRLVAGGAVCAGGLALLLGVAQPSSGTGPPIAAAGWIVAVTGVIVLVAVAVGIRARDLSSAVALASGTGVLYGVNAAVTKLLAEDLTRGAAATVTHWPVYASLIIGPTGLLLSQRAFQVGRLLAPVNAVISTVDPITATVIAVLVLGERLNSASLAVLGEVTGAAVVVLGIVITVRRSGRILRDPAVTGRG
jgi:drug/metabolite transporter (DMT)-like permease